MKIDILEVGPLETNCYILSKEGKCLIIDPGYDKDFIINKIEEQSLKPLGIIITHNHPDHTKEAEFLKDTYKIDIYDYNNLFEKKHIIGPFNFEVIYTPGHEQSSITIYFYENNIMFTGDFIFHEDIGRVDLPTGSYKEMLESINKIKKYDQQIIIYPGHGKETTLEHEINNNEYF